MAHPQEQREGWQEAPIPLRDTSEEAIRMFALQITQLGTGEGGGGRGEGESSKIFHTVLPADQQRSESQLHVLK